MSGVEQLRLVPARVPGQIIERAFEAYKPDAAYVMFSGGKDSSVTLDLLHRQFPDKITGVVHVYTTIAAASTREFCRKFCAERGLDFIQLQPSMTFEEMVVRDGFYGPGLHELPYNELKGKPLEAFARSQKRSRLGSVVLYTGVRVDESARRARLAREITARGAIKYVAPLIDFTRQDMQRYRDEFSVEMSPCARTICFSGDCFCGSKARVDKGEREVIATFEPQVDAELTRLEKRVKAAGHSNCVWGVRPPEQPIADDPLDLPLCFNCEVPPTPTPEGDER